jgi:hypothetical protein
MLSSLITSTQSLITAVASNSPRRSVTFREGKEVAKNFALNDDHRCSTSETVDEDESDVCCMAESSEFYYQKEKWNPNNYNNPLKRNDYFDDDEASLELDDIFPEATSTQCQRSSTDTSFPRIDLMHGTRNLNCFLSDEELDEEVSLSESFSFIYVSQEDMEAEIMDKQQNQSSVHEHKKPVQESSFTTVKNTSFQSLSGSPAF